MVKCAGEAAYVTVSISRSAKRRIPGTQLPPRLLVWGPRINYQLAFPAVVLAMSRPAGPKQLDHSIVHGFGSHLLPLHYANAVTELAIRILFF